MHLKPPNDIPHSINPRKLHETKYYCLNNGPKMRRVIFHPTENDIQVTRETITDHHCRGVIQTNSMPMNSGTRHIRVGGGRG